MLASEGAMGTASVLEIEPSSKRKRAGIGSEV